MSGLVDLSRLPPPDVVETLDYEAILADRKARLKKLLDDAEILPDWNPDQESDPLVKYLEESAYREMLLRQRVNDGARAVMLASATDADLDQIGARYNVARMVVQAADPTAIPPLPELKEGDTRFRRRIQLAFEGFSTAGPEGAYIFHTLSADVRVKDCSITRPQPGDVLVTVLSTEGDGAAAPDLLANVAAALNDEKVRPLNDTVIVASAEIVPYAIRAVLDLSPGPDGETVRQAALDQARAYAESVHVCAGLVARSGVDGAVHRPGVRRATMPLPAADIVTTALQAPYCTGIDIELTP